MIARGVAPATHAENRRSLPRPNVFTADWKTRQRETERHLFTRHVCARGLILSGWRRVWKLRTRTGGRRGRPPTRQRPTPHAPRRAGMLRHIYQDLHE
eukprot:scaffold77453_cov72-Phaeocystis_antarctica.AAC.4